MQIYHVERNKKLALKEQIEELKQLYRNFRYLHSDGTKIHFIAE